MKYTDDYDDNYDDEYADIRDNKHTKRKYNPDARKRIEDRLEKQRLKRLCSDVYYDDLELPDN